MNMKAAATLTGSLLARKGAAYPAAYAAPSTTDSSDGAQPQRAYNDPRVIASAAHAVETGAPATLPATPAAGTQMQDGRFVEDMPQQEAAPAPAVETSPEAGDDLSVPQAMDKMGRVRLSVRLDPDRYLRVKMASARTRWSAQDIVIAALDRYLGGAAGSGGKTEGSDDEGSVN